jgi:transcriptional antiterminator NusG
MKWYVVQVISGQERKVKAAIEDARIKKNMEDLVGEVLVPTENVSEVKAGQQIVSEKKLWPGYILVNANLTEDAWMFVRNTSGVLGFLGGEKPTPLSQREVDEILLELQEKKKSIVHKHNISVGEVVKIIDGVFVNFIGTVTEVFHDKGRVSVLVSIFGRDTRVDDLEFWQVELLPADKR